MEQGYGEPRTENLYDGEVRDMITTLGKLAAVGFVAALAAAQLAPTSLSDQEKHSLWGGANDKCRCLVSCTVGPDVCEWIVDQGCKNHDGKNCFLTTVNLCSGLQGDCLQTSAKRATNTSEDCPTGDPMC